MGQFDKALADCNSVIEKMPKNQYRAGRAAAKPIWPRADLDAALKDFNFVLGLNPNHVRAHAGRGELFERSSTIWRRRAPTIDRPVFALTPYDELRGRSWRARRRASGSPR